ncbi:PTS lactose/cellobiose transporter subunit IIA [Ligilactobacillus sp. Marseille-Q7487]|uniref:PTS lactose/cellobiose transporter subunit IIA n=1 Tax=Ligilactobacillus sp. Marseille-Q7487 TaxID=3022128 RepID=UPI0024A7FA32|nr:PTS lactose/cellobiose transporter subunit IIA [Ligilactobacillus sp. Marseille-Q7487]
MNEMERNVMVMISSAGQSKAKAFEALKMVKLGDYEKARKLLQESKDADLEAHKIQTKLIQEEIASGKNNEVNLLVVHAQDHYMTSQLARDLIEELINVFEAKEK